MFCKLPHASSWEISQLSTTFPVCIMCTYGASHIWQPDKAVPPSPSFRRFSTTAASSELLDGSVGASGGGSCERFASEKFAGRGCRRRPRSGARCLQRFPHPLERSRPRHPHPEGSQSGVCEAAIDSIAAEWFKN